MNIATFIFGLFICFIILVVFLILVGVMFKAFLICCCVFLILYLYSKIKELFRGTRR